MNTNVKVLLSRGMTMPAYATDGSAAVDLRAAVEENAPVTIQPGERAMIPTGMAIALENANVVAILAARSGLAVKHGITRANSVGVIDQDYRGEIKVVLLNHSNQPQTLEPGERVAQFVITPVLTPAYEEAEDLSDTSRGIGGFGSTGK